MCPERTMRANQAWLALIEEYLSGGVLLSHTVTRAVPSALRGLASGFGMEPGVSLSLWPPKLYGDVAVPPVALWPARHRQGSRPHLGNRTVDAYAFRTSRSKQQFVIKPSAY